MENISAVGEEGKDYNMSTIHQVDVTQFWEYQTAAIIWKVCPPCILLLGGFGNVAIVVVMRRIKDHNSSQHVILMALAVSDLFLLYTGGLRFWMVSTFRVDVRDLHTAVCKLYKWLVYSLNTTSAWLVTGVTAQRTMAVIWPHRIRRICTVRRTWLVVSALVLTAFLLNVHLLLGMEINKEKSDRCKEGRYIDFYRYIFTWLDLGVSSFFPCLSLIVCNTILSWTLFQAASSSTLGVGNTVSVVSSGHHSDSRRKTSSKTTVMVLALSCCFLVLTMPICVYLIWYSYADAHIYIAQDPQLQASNELAYTVTFVMWFTNSAVNFLLYCLTGTKFRREFSSWVRCGARSH